MLRKSTSVGALLMLSPGSNTSPLTFPTNGSGSHTPSELSPESHLAKTSFFSRRNFWDSGNAGKAGSNASLDAALRPRRHSTSGFLASGQPEKGLPGLPGGVRPLRRPSTLLSCSASEGQLPLASKGHNESLQNDPVKMVHCPVVETEMGDRVLRDDFYAAFDIYQSVANGVGFSQSQYRKAIKSEAGHRALQIVQSLMVHNIRNAHIPSLKHFLRQVWPQLSPKEEKVLLLWAKQREGQTYAKYRMVEASVNHGPRGFSNGALSISFSKSF